MSSPWDILTGYARGDISAAEARRRLHVRSQIELVHALIDAGHAVPADDEILAVQVRLRRLTGWKPWDNDLVLNQDEVDGVLGLRETCRPLTDEEQSRALDILAGIHVILRGDDD